MIQRSVDINRKSLSGWMGMG